MARHLSPLRLLMPLVLLDPPLRPGVRGKQPEEGHADQGPHHELVVEREVDVEVPCGVERVEDAADPVISPKAIPSTKTRPTTATRVDFQTGIVLTWTSLCSSIALRLCRVSANLRQPLMAGSAASMRAAGRTGLLASGSTLRLWRPPSRRAIRRLPKGLAGEDVGCLSGGPRVRRLPGRHSNLPASPPSNRRRRARPLATEGTGKIPRSGLGQS